jgi:hypothetical protein
MKIPAGPVFPFDLQSQEAIAAIRMASLYQSATIFHALVEKGLIDPQRVYGLNEVLASGFDQRATLCDDPAKATANRLIAGFLREFKVTIQNAVTIPADAGHA